MPIYEYRCDKCGLEKEYLQKLSDPPIAACPCGESTMTKLVSAAGFQLKGSGWYVTDFRDKGGKAAAKTAGDADAKPADKAADAPATATPAATSTPATPDKPAAASAATKSD
ncbi:MAG: zinc ribbon domain-containing protein [Burkholderiales bacterium]|jgi:putative FmdB family regulatory protein|nr:zinc ribbon domain-containing protein [Burkholderiales bacterium]